ncbi:MAG TPA: TonB-dependent receptor [Candidatus Baltobacteraceae bacterium]
MKTTIVRPVAALCCAATLLLQAAPVRADATTATIGGLVIDQRNALPVPNASITVSHAGAVVATGTTTSDGHFRLTGLAPGVYDLTFRARGYDVVANDSLAVTSGDVTSVDIALPESATTAPSTLTTIGRVTASASQLLAATTISQTISVSDLTRTGQIRVADEFSTLPGVNFSTSSSVGDDASISLRGLGPDETAMLLDGHPVGPLGVGSGGFNFSLGTPLGLSSVDVTYGSGAQGLYGNDTIGGAVNFMTISPTQKPQATFQQQFGGFGISSTGVTATGTFNRLGYALAVGRLGESGDFSPSPVAQSARPNNVVSGSVNPPDTCDSASNDVSACNLALNTYPVSQNTEQSLELGKLSYALGHSTKLEATAYDAVQWSDSTGNGDNDYLPYNVRLGQVLKGTSDCTTPGGTASYTVTTDPVAGTTACDTAQQFAGATYGPDGGGAGRDRSTRMGDYHLRLTTQAGINSITLDGYANNYVYWKNSSLAGGVDASGDLLGTPTFANYYNTGGFLASDELQLGQHDVAFGFDMWHQLQTGNENDASGLTVNPPAFFGEWSAFVRDSYDVGDRYSAFINAWLKHSSVSLKTTFDPRATLQFHPSSADVFQVTYGRSDGAPSPSLLQTGIPVASDPGASLTSVDCNGYNDVTGAGNPSLLSESSNDYEFGYGHRFKGEDSNIQLTAYVTNVTDQLFGASEPLLQYGANNVNFAPGALQTYINRLDSQCGVTLNNQTVLGYLSVSTTYNAASALARGIELSGREHLNRLAYIDYSYDIESSANVGIDSNILQNNATVINGAQLSGIPLHQASVSLDLAQHGTEFRIDNYFMSENNPFNRPAYWHSNAFLSHAFAGGRTLVTLGGTNIFNNAVQDYGYLGLGTVPAVNQFATGPASASEEFGLAPAQLTLTLQEHI